MFILWPYSMGNAIAGECCGDAFHSWMEVLSWVVSRQVWFKFGLGFSIKRKLNLHNDSPKTTLKIKTSFIPLT
jgi:hypothetical protein